MTSIEWCDETWNPVVGCTRVSAGCDNCYAIGVAHRNLSPRHRGLTKVRPRDATRPGVDWNGEIRLAPENLALPLKWRKPRRVFVNSMSDLFHERVPFEFIAAVFGVMAACPQHTFLVLTKRPARAIEFFRATFGLEDTETTIAVEAERYGVIWDARGSERWRYRSEPTGLERRRPWVWPLPNVHLGVSAEDQATWDERVPLLMQCPAAVRWVSAEPLLGPIEMDGGGHISGVYDPGPQHHPSCNGDCRNCPDDAREPVPFLDWIVVGGESGSRARPFNVAWARSIIAQCHGAGVPVFVKQLGSRPLCIKCDGSGYGDGPGGYCWSCGGATNVVRPLRDRKGGDPGEWPEYLRVREYPEAQR